MTTETTTQPTDTAEHLVTFVMTKNGRRRMFPFSFPALSEESARATAVRIASAIEEGCGGNWICRDLGSITAEAV